MLDLMVPAVGTDRNNNCNGIVAVKKYVQDDVFTADEDRSLVADYVDIDDEDSVLCSATADDSFRIDILCQKGESEENSHQSSKELGSRLTPPSPLAIPNFFRADWLNLKVMESAPMFQNVQPVRPQKARKSRRGPPSRSSPYRGVTFYRRTGRWESHMVENLSKEDLMNVLRQQSNGFSRESSKYCRVTGSDPSQMWSMGCSHGAYDKAAIRCNEKKLSPTLRQPHMGHMLIFQKGTKMLVQHVAILISTYGFLPLKKAQSEIMFRMRILVLGKDQRFQAAGLAVTSMGRQLSVRPSMNSSHTPNNEEMPKGTGSASVHISKRVTDAAWQMQMVTGHHAPMGATAASSGFVSSRFTYPPF
ncbi:hypothetical protein R6Q57_027143 [Mikania cordata]